MGARKTKSGMRKRRSGVHGGRGPAAAESVGRTKPEAVFRLRLYVAGQTPRSTAAVANLRRICDEYLAGKYSVEIIDLMKTPQLARDHQIIAVPTLVRQLPMPLKRIVGDLSDTERTLVGLDLRRSA